MPHPPFRVLVVEENRDDELITVRSLGRCGAPLDIRVARTGVEALAALGLEGESADVFDLVLCDLRLPGLHGDDVLRRARAAPRLAALPFVMLSSSVLEEDSARCLALGASEFAVKPIDLDEYLALVAGIVRRWLPCDEA